MERERIIAVLKGKTPDRIPWATRLDIWYKSHKRGGTLPKDLSELMEMEVYKALNIGRQRYVHLTQTLLKGVEITVRFDGEEISHGRNLTVRFPVSSELVPLHRPGQTLIEFQTPVGTASVIFKTTDQILQSASAPYLEKHLITEESDFRTVHWILEHSRTVAEFEPFETSETVIGDRGLTIGMLGRIPFQRIVLDFLGEERCFYLMFDNPKRFGALLDQLTEIDIGILQCGIDSPAFMLEYGDNFDSEITNPRLFREYCLPRLQQASEKVHAAGKVLGSHMDGDMSLLVNLIPETGLDVVESFSPFPLSSLSFQQAWSAWKNRIIPWGIIPSPIFEQTTPRKLFEKTVSEIVTTIVGEGTAILGIADQAVSSTLPDRILRAGEIVEALGWY